MCSRPGSILLTWTKLRDLQGKQHCPARLTQSNQMIDSSQTHTHKNGCMNREPLSFWGSLLYIVIIAIADLDAEVLAWSTWKIVGNFDKHRGSRKKSLFEGSKVLSSDRVRCLYDIQALWSIWQRDNCVCSPGGTTEPVGTAMILEQLPHRKRWSHEGMCRVRKDPRTETWPALPVTGQQLQTLRKAGHHPQAEDSSTRVTAVCFPALVWNQVQYVSPRPREENPDQQLLRVCFHSLVLHSSQQKQQKLPRTPKAIFYCSSAGCVWQPFLSPLLWKHITSHKFALIITKGEEGQKCSSLLNDPCSLSIIHRRQIQSRDK